MAEQTVSRAFVGRRRQQQQDSRLPPGQYLVDPEWPVLSAGATPRIPLDKWTFKIEGLVREPITWSWDEFLKLRRRPIFSTSAASPTGRSST